MRKLILVFVLLVPVIALAGCSKNVKLKPQESAVVAEYIAGEVLRYDKSYDGALIAPEIEEPDPQENKPSETEGEGDKENKPNVSENTGKDPEKPENSSQNEIKYKTINEVFGLKGFDITYKKYTVADQYPKNSNNSYFTLIPKKGRKNLVVEFNIKNTTDNKAKINLAGAGIKYQLDVNSSATVYMPSITVLMDDINFLDMEIGSKKSKTAILIFDIKENEEMNEVNLFITKKANTAIVKMK